MPFRAAFTLNDGLTSTAGTATGTVPASVQAGDVLAVVAVENTGSATYTISGGGTGAWTLRSGPDDNSNAQRTYLWTKTAVAGSAGSTVTVTSTVSSRLLGAGFAASGVTESSILIALMSDSTSDTSLNWPSVTIPAGGNAWELYSLSTMRAGTTGGGPTISTLPSGSTQDAFAQTAFSTTPNFSAYALHDAAQVAAGSGSTSFGTGTTSVAVTNQLYTIAFQTTASSTPATATGSVTIAGSAPAKAPATTAGAVTLGGTATAKAAASAAGSVTLGGTATRSGPVAAAATGTLTLGGSASPKAAATAQGSISLGGSASPHAPAGASGGITLGGTAAGQGPVRDIAVTYGPVTGTRVLIGAITTRTLTARAAARSLVADPQE